MLNTEAIELMLDINELRDLGLDNDEIEGYLVMFLDHYRTQGEHTKYDIN